MWKRSYRLYFWFNKYKCFYCVMLLVPSNLWITNILFVLHAFIDGLIYISTCLSQQSHSERTRQLLLHFIFQSHYSIYNSASPDLSLCYFLFFPSMQQTLCSDFQMHNFPANRVYSEITNRIGVTWKINLPLCSSKIVTGRAGNLV